MFDWGAFVSVFSGWVTYCTLRSTKPTSLSGISTVIGSVGGAAVIALFPKEDGAFSASSIGLAIGFFSYLFVAGRTATLAARNKKI